ncbi:Aste57867_22241 [Aphanomyces stellatus]|uniref:Aste57867_22241 protein n=1 Tax=Aphanomyces stellatus TaxID=120398 RepID=A0A485LKG9_9STRA|nr:hypothetical protein As57867_022172 [Aphanomyces stellatus]VFT98908.1 Aste57867_22241 [Aphanomyces stellatus]
MATPATENPIAPTSVAIDVPAAASAESDAKKIPVESPSKAAKDPKAKPKDYRAVDLRPDYHVVCCGNSCLDLILVPLTFIVLYGAMLGLSLLVLWANFLTSTTATAHWICFFVYIMCIFVLALSVMTADYEKILKERSAKAQADAALVA